MVFFYGCLFLKMSCPLNSSTCPCFGLVDDCIKRRMTREAKKELEFWFKLYELQASSLVV